MNNQPNLFEVYWNSLNADDQGRYLDQTNMQQMESMFFEGIKLAVLQIQHAAHETKQEAAVLEQTMKSMTNNILERLKAEKAKAKPSVHAAHNLEVEADKLNKQLVEEGAKLLAEIKGVMHGIDKVTQLLIIDTPEGKQFASKTYGNADQQAMEAVINKFNK
jgi:gas vesicle protein